MIRVTWFASGDSQRAFVCAGQSGYAQEGEDIVCAAVSALTVNCVNALESVAHVRPDVKKGQGFLAVRLPKDCESRDAQVLLLSLKQGLRDICAQYPAYIRLKTMAESERRKQ